MMKKDKLTFRMLVGIRFNRKIDREKDYISPGGYAFTMNGKSVRFDFVEYSGSVDKEHGDILEAVCKNPDFSYEDTSDITKEMLSKITSIDEFFVFTGECMETDLRPVELTYCAFELPYENWEEIIVSEDVLKAAKLKSKFEGQEEETTMLENGIKFDERYDDEENGAVTLYFTAPKEMLKNFSLPEYPDAISMEISVEYPVSALPKERAELANVSVSPTNEDGEDYDWTDVTLSKGEVESLLRLANSTSKIFQIVNETIQQLEENAMKCLSENDVQHSEMYSRMAEGARCVKQNLEYELRSL